MKKAKTKGSNVLPNTTYQWETVATNLEEFQDVSGYSIYKVFKASQENDWIKL